MNSNNNTPQPNAPKTEHFEFARPAIVRQLDHDIQSGQITYLIDLLTNSREHLLAKTADGSMIDCELNEYQEWFADLDTIRAVIAFLSDLNRHCPDNLKPERRYQTWQK
jgi:hypothetical protein